MLGKSLTLSHKSHDHVTGRTLKRPSCPLHHSAGHQPSQINATLSNFECKSRTPNGQVLNALAPAVYNRQENDFWNLFELELKWDKRINNYIFLGNNNLYSSLGTAELTLTT